MSQAMADLFRSISTGVYVVGVANAVRSNAFTAAWVMPVSFQPLLLAVSINPQHSSYALLKQGSGFSVNVLSAEQLALAAHFGSSSQHDKLTAVDWRPGHTGAPLLTEVLACFECETVADYPAGDHRLVLGRVINGCVLQAEALPLAYRDTGNMDGAAAIYPSEF